MDVNISENDAFFVNKEASEELALSTCSFCRTLSHELLVHHFEYRTYKSQKTCPRKVCQRCFPTRRHGKCSEVLVDRGQPCQAIFIETNFEEVKQKGIIFNCPHGGCNKKFLYSDFKKHKDCRKPTSKKMNPAENMYPKQSPEEGKYTYLEGNEQSTSSAAHMEIHNLGMISLEMKKRQEQMEKDEKYARDIEKKDIERQRQIEEIERKREEIERKKEIEKKREDLERQENIRKSSTDFDDGARFSNSPQSESTVRHSQRDEVMAQESGAALAEVHKYYDGISAILMKIDDEKSAMEVAFKTQDAHHKKETKKYLNEIANLQRRTNFQGSSGLNTNETALRKKLDKVQKELNHVRAELTISESKILQNHDELAKMVSENENLKEALGNEQRNYRHLEKKLAEKEKKEGFNKYNPFTT